MDVGMTFEILAVANPQQDLAEGDILTGWPEATAESEIVEVARQ